MVPVRREWRAFSKQKGPFQSSMMDWQIRDGMRLECEKIGDQEIRLFGGRRLFCCHPADQCSLPVMKMVVQLRAWPQQSVLDDIFTYPLEDAQPMVAANRAAAEGGLLESRVLQQVCKLPTEWGTMSALLCLIFTEEEGCMASHCLGAEGKSMMLAIVIVWNGFDALEFTNYQSTPDVHEQCDNQGSVPPAVRTSNRQFFRGHESIWNLGHLKLRPARWVPDCDQHLVAFVSCLSDPRGCESQESLQVYSQTDKGARRPLCTAADARKDSCKQKLEFPKNHCHDDRVRGNAQEGQTVDRQRQVTIAREEIENHRSLMANGAAHKDLGSLFDDEYEISQPKAEHHSRLGCQGIEGDYFSRTEDWASLGSPTSSNVSSTGYAHSEKRWGLDIKIPGIRNQTDQYAYALNDDEAQNEADGKYIFGFGPSSVDATTFLPRRLCERKSVMPEKVQAKEVSKAIPGPAGEA